MLLSLALVSLASQSQSWTEDRHTGEGRRRWKGEGTVELHCLFFGLFPPLLLIPHLHLIGFFFPPPVSCWRGVVLWTVVEAAEAPPPLKGSLIEVFWFVFSLQKRHWGLLWFNGWGLGWREGWRGRRWGWLCIRRKVWGAERWRRRHIAGSNGGWCVVVKRKLCVSVSVCLRYARVCVYFCLWPDSLPPCVCVCAKCHFLFVNVQCVCLWWKLFSPVMALLRLCDLLTCVIIGSHYLQQQTAACMFVCLELLGCYG